MKTHIRPFWFALFTAIILIFVADIGSGNVLDNIKNAIDDDSMAYLAHEKDDHGYLTKKSLLNAKSELKDNEKALYVIGGSTLREGFLKDRIIQRDYIEASDPNLRFVSLYSFDQTLAETARIALAQNINEGDTVIINLNPRRLGFAPESLNQELSLSRLSILPEAPLYPLMDNLRSDWPEIQKPQKLSLSVLNHRLFVKQWMKGRLPGPTKKAWSDLAAMRLKDVKYSQLLNFKPRQIRRYLRYAYGSKALGVAEKQKIAETVKTLRVPEYENNNAFGFDLLEELVQLLSKKGATVIFLDLPRAKLSREAYAPVWQDYDSQLNMIISKTGAERIDLRNLPLSEDDFYDLEHVMKPSRAMLSNALIDALKQGGWIKS